MTKQILKARMRKVDSSVARQSSHISILEMALLLADDYRWYNNLAPLVPDWPDSVVRFK